VFYIAKSQVDFNYKCCSCTQT